MNIIVYQIWFDKMKSNKLYFESKKKIKGVLKRVAKYSYFSHLNIK